MKTSFLPALMALSLVLGSSCVDAPKTAPEVAVSVAALDLPGVTNAVYTIEVRNNGGDVVFNQQIDSTGYGAGNGSASYIGPCDASSNPNVVALTLDELYAGGSLIPDTEYRNPGTLERSFTCVENGDVAVDFDLTIIRPANQGFFDIAVTFDNIFCSAKLDCKGQDDQPINLLHDADGTRSTTLVMGLACTTARVGDITTLYRDDVVITCDSGTATVDPDGDGNLDAAHVTDASGVLFAAQVARGQEQFAFDKQYWNLMLGFVDGTANCYLDSAASAARGFFEFRTTPAGNSYPYILWDHIQLTDAAGALVCGRHAVDATPVGVATEYVPLDTPYTFDHLWSTHDVPIQGAGIAGAPRYWADGTVAATCLDYFAPAAGSGYVYDGATGDGIYRIDPDGDGPNAPFETACDMTNGGWTRVAFEDFSTGTTAGWSWYNTVTQCGDVEPTGFGNILWGGTWAGDYSWYTYKQYTWSPIPHVDARVTLDYLRIDSWDAFLGDPPGYDAGYVNFGYQADTANASPTSPYQLVTVGDAGVTKTSCGNAVYSETAVPVSITLADHGSSATPEEAWVRASAVFDEDAQNESFGIDNVAVWVK